MDCCSSVLPMPDLALNLLYMSTLVQTYESLFQDLLIQSPYILKAEVVDVGEYVDDRIQGPARNSATKR